MTLDPVFRSKEAVRQIKEDGFLDRMTDSLKAHREAIQYTYNLLPDIIGKNYIKPLRIEDEHTEFLQNHFFLILFHSVLKTLGCSGERLRFYSRLNFCIKGIVTAGDNIFDNEAKELLPLNMQNNGIRFKSIVQLLCFDRLLHSSCNDEITAGWLTKKKAAAIQKDILNQLICIGKLEGSEENGVDVILTVDEMVEKVHRVRGGMLFSLAFIAPLELEDNKEIKKLKIAENAISNLGTAFQIVDDLTDFEFDLSRRSNNLLCAAAFHGKNESTRIAIRELLNGKKPEPNMVETVFAENAYEVLERARNEGKKAFEQLAELGFWFPPEHSSDLIHAIVGIEGVSRMEELTSMAK